ncbi:hypothetical protein [Streptomyces sp. NPDC004008]
MAVVIGEQQRTFYGNQFGNTFPVFMHFRIPLWVPEVGGPIDPDNEAHDLVMSVFGGMSKGERNRIKSRVRTAMSSQAQLQGRYLGGRPPYGYRIADAGPHWAGPSTPGDQGMRAAARPHQAALDAGADPAVVTQWINEAQRDKDAAQKKLDAHPFVTRKRQSRSTPDRSGGSLRVLEILHSASRMLPPRRKARSTRPWASRSPMNTPRGPRP